MEPAGQARVERRLAAILAADVAGYSRLIEADEEGTLSRLKALRAEIIDPKIAGHKGRIVKTTGDGLLVEFASVVDALRCAAEMQSTLTECIPPLPPDRRIEFAIQAFERAMRLSPLDPQTYYFVGGIAFAYLYMRRFEEAIEWADRSLNHEPPFTPVLRVKLVACAQLGRVEEARQSRRRVDELQPGLTIAQLKNYPGCRSRPKS